jgi:hypothetical protein
MEHLFAVREKEWGKDARTSNDAGPEDPDDRESIT